MAVSGGGSWQATTTLAEFEGHRVSPMQDAGFDSLFRLGRRAASELTANSTAAALRRRIGARGAASGAAIGAAKTGVARERPRSRRPRGGEPVPAPPPPEPPSPARPSRVRDPEHHLFDGNVSVTVGPFESLDAIGELAEALSSIPGVGSVRIRTFERSSVVYDVDLAEPTALITRLRGRSYRPLRLLYANERIIRMKLV